MHSHEKEMRGHMRREDHDAWYPFCVSLFELSCQFSLDISAKKYMALNSFLDRVLNENYEYFSPKNLMSKNRKIFDF